MNQINITLELLVRNGNPKGVEKFARLQNLGEQQKKDKIAEAGIYSAIKYMGGEESDCGIDSERICRFLSQKRFKDYFSHTTNINLLLELVDVLQSGTNVSMEAYAQITPFDVFGMDFISDAIKRNIDAPRMREKVTNLVQSGYSLVFCPHDIDACLVNHYFPLVDKWRDLVNPVEIAQGAIEGFADNCTNLFDENYDYKKKFVYASLDKLIELTDRETVSGLMQEHFWDSENYQRFIDDGKIDAYSPRDVSKSLTDTQILIDTEIKVQKAVREYEKNGFPSDYNVKDMAEKIGDNGKEYIAQKMNQWFRLGKMRHLKEIAVFEEGRLYNHEIARREISEAIAETCEKNDIKKLSWIFELPQDLIDENNPFIAGVANAYRINQETKSKPKKA